VHAARQKPGSLSSIMVALSPAVSKSLYMALLDRVADGYFFTAAVQAREWFKNKKQIAKVMPVMEGASFFNYAERDSSRTFDLPDKIEARKRTGMNGSPVMLWVGRLDENKDPLTVLDGFAIICREYPEAQLYMICNSDMLQDQVKEKIEGAVDLKR
jgi:glycosyltransferase involved in cell wall biosynthesis